eukprot:3400980-Karenia_brevis.AAC.1
MARRRQRAQAERENLRNDDRRTRDPWVRNRIDHYRTTGKVWVDFDPIEEMTDADLDYLFEDRTEAQKEQH